MFGAIKSVREMGLEARMSVLSETYTPPKAVSPHALLANDCAEFGIVV